ncbi:hypothetical protein ACWIW6_08770, partial [Ursidibacter sp. B-7004-1]
VAVDVFFSTLIFSPNLSSVPDCGAEDVCEEVAELLFGELFKVDVFDDMLFFSIFDDAGEPLDPELQAVTDSIVKLNRDSEIDVFIKFAPS